MYRFEKSGYTAALRTIDQKRLKIALSSMND